jgi:pimeloyl-ACP methyl ester carboxylesterase
MNVVITGASGYAGFYAALALCDAGHRVTALLLAGLLWAGPLAAQVRPAGGAEAEFNRTFTHRYATVNGVKLHYVTGGKGPALFLVHGWPTTWREWEPVMRALSQRYTLVVPDLRGLGDSEKPGRGYDSSTVAEDLHQLAQQLGHAHLYLAGHDIGGGPAYVYAATYPQEVARLAIIEGGPAGLQPPAAAAAPAAGAAGGHWHVAFHAVPDLPETLVAGRERAYLNYFFKTYAANPRAVTEAEIDRYARAYADPAALRAGFAYYRAMAGEAAANQERARRKLSMPVLALGGDKVMGDAVRQIMQTAATDVRGGTLKNCGHWVMSEQPQELVRQLADFFPAQLN